MIFPTSYRGFREDKFCGRRSWKTKNEILNELIEQDKRAWSPFDLVLTHIKRNSGATVELGATNFQLIHVRGDLYKYKLSIQLPK